jgi:hypothetical protein
MFSVVPGGGPRLHMHRIPLGLLTDTFLVLGQILQMTIGKENKGHNVKYIY